MKAYIPLCIAVMLFAGSIHHSKAFGLLSHEAIIDASWEKSIVPFLKEKYPNALEKDLKEARKYVYGGAILPDIGYMPFGSTEFTHLIHYVRTGAFVETLVEEAHDVNELAFALGMMSHYYADNYGHPLGTNRVVPLVFPKEKHKHGDKVAYEDARLKHVRVEFGFDVLQTAKGNYKPEAYNDFIGFRVSEAVLERAFLKTYGLELKDIFKNFKAAVNAFRFSVRNVIPGLTRSAWKARKSFINKMNPLATEENFYYDMKRSAYKKEYGKLNMKSSFISLIIIVLPKIGPLSFLRFKEPTEQGEKLYHEAFETIVAKYTAALKEGTKPRLPDKNFDTGVKTLDEDYELADKAHEKLLLQLRKTDYKNANDEVKQALADYYSSSKEEKKKKKVRNALAEMKR
jgi:hypothetical protein